MDQVELLRDAQMTGFAKLRRSIRSTGERRQWAVRVASCHLP
jgi:hypothetical protein